jgi:hypothetical protein
MKKLLLGAIAVAAMTVGLLAVPAQAGPYTGTVTTVTRVSDLRASVPAGESRRFARAVVRAKSGSVQPRGTVRVICKTRAGDDLVVRRGPIQAYRGEARGVRGPVLYRKKRWSCSVRFNGGQSVFKDDVSGSWTVRVR